MSASHPLAALKAALVARFTADAGVALRLSGGVHDTPPRGRTMPYATFGEATLRREDGDDAPFATLDLELIVLARGRGTAEALAAIEALEAALEAPLALPEGGLVGLSVRDVRVRNDAAGERTRGLLRLRALFEPRT